jgi:hypothetical protein
MASSKMFPIPPDFDMREMVEKITQMYRAKGFMVTAIPMGAGASIDFRKNDGGIQKFVGLALGIKANIMVQNESMIVNFSDAEWMGKIVALTVGWFLCAVPAILGLVGCVQQASFPNTVGNDIQMIVGGVSTYGGSASFAAPQQQYQPAQQSHMPPNQPTAPQVFCNKCGAALAENEQFCANCGNNVQQR